MKFDTNKAKSLWGFIIEINNEIIVEFWYQNIYIKDKYGLEFGLLYPTSLRVISTGYFLPSAIYCLLTSASKSFVFSCQTVYLLFLLFL